MVRGRDAKRIHSSLLAPGLCAAVAAVAFALAGTRAEAQVGSSGAWASAPAGSATTLRQAGLPTPRAAATSSVPAPEGASAPAAQTGTSKRPAYWRLHPAEIPSLLSAMGVINTVVVFVYSTVLSRVAVLRYRRNTTSAFMLAWGGVAIVVIAYMLDPAFDGFPTGLLLDVGLVLWLFSFVLLLGLLSTANQDTVQSRAKGPGIVKFVDRYLEPDFGVAALNLLIRRAVSMRRRVTYPILLIHDMQTSGLALVNRFVRAGLDSEGEAVIYFTFSRSHLLIEEQIRARQPEHPVSRLWIIDCYSPVSMPEVQRATEQSKHRRAWRTAPATEQGIQVLFADPRDPRHVYKRYAEALAQAGRLVPKASVRTVYETLSDFVKIADLELVLTYLRRVVVLEENSKIRSLYVLWDGAVAGNVDQKYLPWFFNTTITMTKAQGAGPHMTTLQLDRLFSDRVSIEVDDQLQHEERNLFYISEPRARKFAGLAAALNYRPAAYDFLPHLRAGDRSRHLANFLFFMVAIDHDTHGRTGRYEAEIGGRLMHGSELLYKLAEIAKEQEPALFLPAAFREVTADALAAIFTPPNGSPPVDLDGRAEIFRSCSKTLGSPEYGGDALRLLELSRKRLQGPGGLFERLEAFPAYGDPVRKKSNLLVKVLLREGLFEPTDRHAVRAAIDHVVMTMALRSGMVRSADERTRKSLASGESLDSYRMQVLREVTQTAIDLLSAKSGLPQDLLDDLVWSYGRKALREKTPLNDAAAISSEIDTQLDASKLPAFISFMNGIDAEAEAEDWKKIPMVTGPFTRFY